MAAHYIQISGFAEEKWETKVGIFTKPDAARQKRVVLKGDAAQPQDLWLPLVEREASNRYNQLGVAR